MNSELTQNSKLKIYSQDLITYDGKEFKKFPKLNAYNQKRKIKKIVYKCQYRRKDEKLRIETNQKPFCEDTIEYIETGQKVKSGYFFKKYHSLECDDMLYGKKKNLLTNIISKWKNNTYRFKKECVFYDTKDYENLLILREFRLIPIETDNKEKNKYLEYIIWGNSENIMRLKVSKNLFIDGTFHHPLDITNYLLSCTKIL